VYVNALVQFVIAQILADQLLCYRAGQYHLQLHFAPNIFDGNFLPNIVDGYDIGTFDMASTDVDMQQATAAVKDKQGPPWRSTSPSRSAKTRRVPGRADHEELIINVARLSLQTARQQRQHSAALQHVVIFPDKHPVFVAAVNAGEQYDEERKRLHRPPVTAPHVFAWRACLQAVLAALIEKKKVLSKIILQDLDLLQKHCEDDKECSVELEQNVITCWAGTAHAAGTGKLVLETSLSYQHILAAMLRSIAFLGGTVKYGTPPRGPLERAVQSALRKAGAID
jgi:hypothetical protein